MNATPSSIDRRRPVPRVGDNLDRLLDQLDKARDEQEARIGQARLTKPRLLLLQALDRTA